MFDPAKRAVSNWREEAAKSLEISERFRAELDRGSDLPSLPRCVKLNNYWCIKRAGWSGEIAADDENHVAFAAAADGAFAAALLLQRYYTGYRLRTAIEILSRWAPAPCGAMPAMPWRARKPAAATPATLGGIAPFGINNTLRARWLAAHRPLHPGAVKPSPLRRPAMRPISLAMMPAPEIALGMGEALNAPVKLSALEFSVPAARLDSFCSHDAARVRNYARRAIAGIAQSPDEDLKLFSPSGAPGSNLARLLANMAKVEIGPFAASESVITAAISRLYQHRAPEGGAAGSPHSSGTLLPEPGLLQGARRN
ncbi:MAG TPA: hypothetical protein VFG05_04685 [Methylocella sp.]|nr:hypothetical protein [Methylocella sp.]